MWLTWPERSSKSEGKDFAIASDYLETWDDSDNITAVNARKIGDMLQKWCIATQKHNIKVSRSTVNIQKIVGTELRLESTIL